MGWYSIRIFCISNHFRMILQVTIDGIKQKEKKITLFLHVVHILPPQVTPSKLPHKMSILGLRPHIKVLWYEFNKEFLTCVYLLNYVKWEYVHTSFHLGPRLLALGKVTYIFWHHVQNYICIPFQSTSDTAHSSLRLDCCPPPAMTRNQRHTCLSIATIHCLSISVSN